MLSSQDAARKLSVGSFYDVVRNRRVRLETSTRGTRAKTGTLADLDLNVRVEPSCSSYIPRGDPDAGKQREWPERQRHDHGANPLASRAGQVRTDDCALVGALGLALADAVLQTSGLRGVDLHGTRQRRIRGCSSSRY